jgi:hypothetical protein
MCEGIAASLAENEIVAAPKFGVLIHTSQWKTKAGMACDTRPPGIRGGADLRPIIHGKRRQHSRDVHKIAAKSAFSKRVFKPAKGGIARGKYGAIAENSKNTRKMGTFIESEHALSGI